MKQKSIFHTYKWFVCLFWTAVFVYLSAVFGCSGNDDADNFLDAMTSATPGVAKYVLDQTNHSGGWGKADCGVCHQSNTHTSGFTGSQCARCHGTNGSPQRPQVTCEDTDCSVSGCHGTKHAEMNFSSSNDCRSCHKYNVADPDVCSCTEDYDVVVIGAGGGGLAAAATLAQGGKTVLLLEQHNRVGGMMTNFVRNDYRFEASLHGFDGMGLDYLEKIGIRDRVKPLRAEPVIYRAILPEYKFDVPSDVAQYRKKMKEAFPSDSASIDKLFDEFSDIVHIVINHYNDTLLELLQRDYNFSNKNVIPIFISLAPFLGVEPEELPAFMFAGMWNGYHTMGGYFQFEGGSQSLSDALSDVIEENGGVIKLNSKATKIVIAGGLATEVKTEDGCCYTADYVISNANAPDTYLKMIGEENLAPDFVSQLKSLNFGYSTICAYLGTDKDFSKEFGSTHELMVTNSYNTNDNYLSLNNCDAVNTDFGVANMTMLDPTTAPEGKNVIFITGTLAWPCGDEWGWNSSYEDYQKYMTKIAGIYIKRAENLIPGLTDHIEVLEVSTPQTIKAFTLNPQGSIFGWKFDQDRFAMPFDEENINTPIPNLYLAGAWANGGGQSVVLITGYTAANKILEQ